MKKFRERERNKRRPSGWLGKTCLILILGLAVICVWVMTRDSGPFVPRRAPSNLSTFQRLTDLEGRPKQPAKSLSENTPSNSAATHGIGTTLIPKPMQLAMKVLASKKWNSAVDAFGRLGPPAGQEGAAFGPSSVAYAKDKIYVLDSVNSRVLSFDKNGELISTVALPAAGIIGDLVIDPSDSSLLVIDHLNDIVFKVKGNEAVTLQSVSMKKTLTSGSRFEYDPASGVLFAHDFDKGGDVPVMKNGQAVNATEQSVQALSSATGDCHGNNLVLSLKDGENLMVTFDKPVQCVEEVVTDGGGIVWVLYTLEGDYRMRRLARVDPVQRAVGVAEIDTWFAFDASRHMTATENGVVLFAGDLQEGRLLSFNYEGEAL